MHDTSYLRHYQQFKILDSTYEERIVSPSHSLVTIVSWIIVAFVINSSLVTCGGNFRSSLIDEFQVHRICQIAPIIRASDRQLTDQITRALDDTSKRAADNELETRDN